MWYLKNYNINIIPKVKRKEENRFKGFNQFNKREDKKVTKHLNNAMDEAADEFYK